MFYASIVIIGIVSGTIVQDYSIGGYENISICHAEGRREQAKQEYISDGLAYVKYSCSQGV